MVDTAVAPPEQDVRVLDIRECWAHLQREEFGRLAVVLHGAAEIFPVNYLAGDGRIRIRTAPGAKLVALVIDNRVTFEIDGFDGDTAWSVIVKGLAEEVDLRPAPRQAIALPIPWTPSPKDSAVEITPDSVSGRLFKLQQGRRVAATLPRTLDAG
jgi:uncharacterized protein